MSLLSGKIYNLISKKFFYLKNKNKNANKIFVKKIVFHFRNKQTCLDLVSEIFYDEIYKFNSKTKIPKIIDAGANIGISVLYFKQLYPAAQILAFEPEPQTFSVLQKNIVSNNVTNVKIYMAALSDKNSKRKLFCDSSNSNYVGMALNRRLEKRGFPTHSVLVSCLKLSKFINSGIDLLKMDIEGSETEVLTDLIRSNKIKNIKNLVLEYHQDSAYKNKSLGNLITMLEKQKFTVGFRKHIGSPFAGFPWSKACIIYATTNK